MGTSADLSAQDSLLNFENKTIIADQDLLRGISENYSSKFGTDFLKC